MGEGGRQGGRGRGKKGDEGWGKREGESKKGRKRRIGRD